MTGNQADLAIIVPVLNEIETLPSLLNHLQHWQQRGAEIVLVDGGSQDATVKTARNRGFRVLQAPRGRALQMNAGARSTRASILVFLHADTRLPDDADQRVLSTLTGVAQGWGRFDVRIEGRSRMLPVIAGMMNWRSRLSGIATGDQALFMTRDLFERIEGFPEQPLMEDIEISKRLKQLCQPVCLRQKVITSGRRWDTRGCWPTILLMWQLRWAYWRGTPPEQLAERYR
ncbi:TIGR04283 family arsenosugar biosynthesis glycosyltransferase [Marinobacterium sediminicola]|uniref:Transferase 2, rSAM/selenodomain-associated n=1 Tax=Marinobacterium sediminicola TaxID=518898 RepID=A0ABY1S2Y3_9GAMM|nr:TIGR04283 family arsenosugar biosynthesis glycosyltransferase [Marinobacterium sediminicola]ULG70686.1 TIGR04283 family arsenosugar biosynthesis glycosyltransferase [Marinobacterium sediminicola]SMR77226.1 transferase 2, rSAM/selenodomain-associated [Marinobacterium sediminicola]